MGTTIDPCYIALTTLSLGSRPNSIWSLCNKFSTSFLEQSHAAIRPYLSSFLPRHNLRPPIVKVAPGRKVTRLVAAELPEYKKVDDTAGN
ncbi:hypothetical protein BDR06DRAFT_954651 [Suillus hirtellus]|nr:hypothetical protein BDR06DRAFT_954651 [Suillus hirtellus]